MAYAIRIDNVQVASGIITVSYTAGQTPLPATWQGASWVFEKNMMLAHAANFDVLLQDMLFKYLLWQWRRLDANLTPSQVIGKTITLNLNSLVNSLNVT